MIEIHSPPRRIVRVIASFLADRRFHVQVGKRGITGTPHPGWRPAGELPVARMLCVLHRRHSCRWASAASPLRRRRPPTLRHLLRCRTLSPRSSRRLTPFLTGSPNGGYQSMWAKRKRFITGRTTALPDPPSLLAQPLTWSPSVKYLGVTIERRLNMDRHAADTVRRAKVARMCLRPVFCSKLPVRTKLGLYKAYVRSRVTYASPAWYSFCSRSNKEKMRRQETLTLWTILKCPRYVSNAALAETLKWRGLEEFVERLARVMFDHADNAGHDHLRDIAPHHTTPDLRRGGLGTCPEPFYTSS
ncbi:uncharacterized protein LOC133533628 [Cydia pomonella]|uniref:uncharacterized protein LOC133533628 n=1 Tax=Cydia pomonella TaxID=82600 RepID=UPI002ADDC9DB|nr:uncharacterized protein LOC133533628 [Cydia pomonella]